MRLSTLCLQGALLGIAIAHEAYLYTFDQFPRSPKLETISSDTAYSIIARRQGLSENRVLRDVDETTLRQLNSYGGRQKALFGDPKDDREMIRFYVQISGYEGVQTPELRPVSLHKLNPACIDVPKLSPADLAVSAPTLDLEEDFSPKKRLAQDQNAFAPCTYDFEMDGGVKGTYNLLRQDACPPKDDNTITPTAGEGILQLYNLVADQVWSSPHPVSMNVHLDYSHVKRSSDAHTLLQTLIYALARSGASSVMQNTLVIFPPSSELAQPRSPSTLIQRRSDETPLDIEFSTTSFPDLPIKILATSNTTLPPLPIRLPACFASVSACENATFSCLGRGKCVQAQTSCFKCACARTVIRAATGSDGNDGEKTIQWAGAACQKKDISGPFALFAVYGILIAMLISGVIGMLLSMGGQQLPSVIGAGVGGPQRPK